VCSEVVLGECDGEGGVGGEVELGVAFTPVPTVELSIRFTRTELGGLYLMTAMLTGAYVLAR